MTVRYTFPNTADPNSRQGIFIVVLRGEHFGFTIQKQVTVAYVLHLHRQMYVFDFQLPLMNL